MITKVILFHFDCNLTEHSLFLFEKCFMQVAKFQIVKECFVQVASEVSDCEAVFCAGSTV